MIKKYKSILFALITAAIVTAIYFLEYKAEEKKIEVEQSVILNEKNTDINFISIAKPGMNVLLQKNEKGNWILIEPIQDDADQFKIDELIKQLLEEKQISIVKQQQNNLTMDELKEFGLDVPAIEFQLKNKSGRSKKISVGSIKNFEGYSFLRYDSENKIVLANPFWHEKSVYDLIYYREKRLFRDDLSNVVKIKVKSIRDEFELALVNRKWKVSGSEYELDQNRVRDVLKKISETNILQYVFEGEPSSKLVKEKGLNKNQVYLEMHTQNSFWSVTLSLKPDEKALYALTERPTYLVKIEIPAWELIGNLSVDDLRDRSSALAFDLKEVKNFYYKSENNEFNLSADAGAWKAKMPVVTKIVNQEGLKTVLNKIHGLKISEFLDTPVLRSKFEGHNMLILKSENQKLVLQLNWGPSFKMKKAGREKEFYFARTHLSPDTFAIEKKLIDDLEISSIYSSKNINTDNQKNQEKPGGNIE